MFLPQFTPAIPRLALGLGLLIGSASAALAQSARPATLHAVTLHATRSYHVPARSYAMLAALSAEAGIPFFATEAQAAHSETAPAAPPPDPALCLRAGLGLAAAVMSGSQMTVQHGLIGCQTETAGLPISVSSDPALAPPPTSRTGEYSVDVMLRYRLLHRKRLQVEASVTEQALAYSIDSPISGNNLLAAMSVRF